MADMESSRSGPEDSEKEDINSLSGNVWLPRVPRLPSGELSKEDPIEYLMRGHIETALTEHSLVAPNLVDYATKLCVGFASSRSSWSIRSARGESITKISQMLQIAESSSQDTSQLRTYAKIGDIVLFYDSVFPDGIVKLMERDVDGLFDYKSCAVRSYLRAAEILEYYEYEEQDDLNCNSGLFAFMAKKFDEVSEALRLAHTYFYAA